MSISRKHLNSHKGSVYFEAQSLADVLKKKFPSIRFCLLMGSAKNGKVNEGSDLDLAIFLNERPELSFYAAIEDAVHEVVPKVRVDVGFLNRAEPVFRFEALKGTLLFVRDMDEYASFFSKTCREYESQLFDYERQHKYRLEAGHAV